MIVGKMFTLILEVNGKKETCEPIISVCGSCMEKIEDE
jgi:hypothetical protein